MKKIGTSVVNYRIVAGLLVMLLAVAACTKDDRLDSWMKKNQVFYYYKGEKIFLNVDYSRVSVSMRGENARRELENTLHRGETIKSFSENNPWAGLENAVVPADKYYYAEVEIAGNQSAGILENTVKQIRKSSAVLMVAPGLITGDGFPIGVSNHFYVKLRRGSDYSSLKLLARNHKIAVLGNMKFMPLWYVLSCDSKSSYGAIDAANRFYESGMFDAAEPEFLGKVIFTQYNFLHN